jgi:hypothetical protein
VRALIIAVCLAALAGCARDNYAVTPDGPGSQARLSADLRDCKQIAIHEHFEAHPYVPGGGALGGLAQGIDAVNQDNPNRRIEACMRRRGYSGTSEG